jgi:hypothetical protein
MYRYTDVTGIPPPAAPAAAAQASADVASVAGGGSAVAEVSPSAAAPKRRLCAACRQPGHQANSKNCPNKHQKLELESHGESDDEDEE